MQTWLQNDGTPISEDQKFSRGRCSTPLYSGLANSCIHPIIGDDFGSPVAVMLRKNVWDINFYKMYEKSCK